MYFTGTSPFPCSTSVDSGRQPYLRYPSLQAEHVRENSTASRPIFPTNPHWASQHKALQQNPVSSSRNCSLLSLSLCLWLCLVITCNCEFLFFDADEDHFFLYPYCLTVYTCTYEIFILITLENTKYNN